MTQVGFRSPEQWEQMAKEQLDKGAFEYIQSGAGVEDTLQANINGFKKWHIVPRVLRNVANVDSSSTILGLKTSAPFALAPVGFQTIIHPEGELAVAKAAAAENVPYTVSTVSTYSMEEIAEVMGDAPRFFQLYWPNDEDIALSFVRRAEQSGYSAIFITVDTPMLGWREQDKSNKYFPLRKAQGLGNYLVDPVFQEKARITPDSDLEVVIKEVASRLFNPSLTWENIKWLRTKTDLPLVIKGIVHPDDAKLAVEYGMDGIVVSNHGGRQLDGSISSIDALPAIVETVQGRIEIVFDGGVRRGVDVIKALALGANSVLIGRLYAYGLTDGQDGVESVIAQLKEEVQTVLALTGETNVKSLQQVTLKSM
ncbi:alpha-hydroxy-acid oxidizing protein [Alkalihalobacillus sp. MEB130]|uniref:alpha-hydroxy-acid oxidizing protein n=1 Tax=Alkalihalobacillus sp. MEB130 TaxID=2976704 RepID=UPI0028E04A01|nr:alpha-hydroxy-acid oxidizing protein [Alkalihalobacillus sp. MEB130]MDT8859824.1 alpha-hydroxy-acid oxidizing protein [Alkalihalobacillus sp. MEB130]